MAAGGGHRRAAKRGGRVLLGRPASRSGGIDWRSAFRLAIVLGVVFVLILSFGFIVRPLILLVAGISIAQAFAPLVRYGERWLPRTAAVLLIYLLLLLVLGGVVWVIFPRLVAQAQGFVDAGPAFIERLQGIADDWDLTQNDQLIDIGIGQLERVGAALAGLPLTIASGALDVFLILAISLYWLLATPALLRFALSLAPERHHAETQAVLSEMGQTMGGYVRGQGIVAIIMGVLTYAGLEIIGVQYALFLALVAAFLEILPIIGPIIATVPIVLVALLDSPRQAVIVFIFWVVLQQVEAYVLTPNIMHSQADVPPLLVLLAIFTGGAALGLLGAIVAIPLSGALRVFVLRVVAPAIRDWTGAGEGARTHP
jgi:predicted PurR-regulated permease PerM